MVLRNTHLYNERPLQKIPKNSENKPRGLNFSKALFEGLIFGGLIYGGALRFEIDRASLIVRSKFTVSK